MATTKRKTKPAATTDAVGHFAHTQDADSQIGLDGEMRGPIKLTMMGAGSGFTPRLVSDVVQIKGHDRGEICLVDIDRKRLTLVHKFIALLLAKLGKTEWTVTSSTRRREVMKGSDYIVNCIEVSGPECVRLDNDIPLEYGVGQCIGDTIGPGGLFKSLRTIPVFLEMLKDAEELCPKALVLNYTNPMNMMTLAAGRASSMQVVGLCHSVQGTSHQLARRAGIKYAELDWECAGINHLAWFTKLERKGKSLYPKLMKMARQDLAGEPSNPDDAEDLVRKDMMLHFGAFITESSGHLSEYVPYYRTHKKVMKQYFRRGKQGATSYYADSWPAWRKNVDATRALVVSGKRSIEEQRKSGWARSWEYASWIIEAHQKDSPFRIYGNVMNSKDSAGPLIGNLPHDGCVEVACMIDRNGINPTIYGDLPPQMAGICRSNMSMFDLGAQAAIEKSKEMAAHALMLDPLTAAMCSPAQIKEMTERMFAAERRFLKGYK
ncbi:MAG: alpha-galactosidase [Candidatus Promineifilaceae bacterium]|jgi:alpha-galactosidase